MHKETYLQMLPAVSYVWEWNEYVYMGSGLPMAQFFQGTACTRIRELDRFVSTGVKTPSLTENRRFENIT